MGSEEATPPSCQTTATNPQPAVTPLDSHQVSCWDSKTNIPPTDRLFRDAPSQNTSWKRGMGKDGLACGRCGSTKSTFLIGDHKHWWLRPYPHTAAPREDSIFAPGVGFVEQLGLGRVQDLVDCLLQPCFLQFGCFPPSF